MNEQDVAIIEPRPLGVERVTLDSCVTDSRLFYPFRDHLKPIAVWPKGAISISSAKASTNAIQQVPRCSG
jgi:hypothetical protein